jgi:hypothetical protein
MTVANPQASPSRACGTCTLCCKLLHVVELNKPRDSWCADCQIGVGCGRYETRPPTCRQFHCGWLLLPELSEQWFPARAKFLLDSDMGGRRITAYVDPARPDAWKEAPYYAQFKVWAKALASHRGQVVISVGKRTIVILPHEDVDLGVVAQDEMIVTQVRQTPAGPVLNALTVKKDDARATAMMLQAPEPRDP